MAKSIMVCCDGTWNKVRQRHVSNVVKLRHVIADRDAFGGRVVAECFDGVGTAFGEKLLGGVFGYGLSDRVREAYRFVAENYEPGDRVYLLGFSRGAYTARSTAGMIRNVGILKKENVAGQLGTAFSIYRDRDPEMHPTAEFPKKFRAEYSQPDDEHEPPVRCIAVWDTVGRYGIPVFGPAWFRRYAEEMQFHNTDLSGRVKFAFQALAVDEFRSAFAPAVWEVDAESKAKGQHVEQVWFTGAHCDVGGGYSRTGLSDLALQWMAERLKTAGLDIRAEAIHGELAEIVWNEDGRVRRVAVAPDSDSKIHRSRRHIYRLMGKVLRPIGQVEANDESAAWSAKARIGAAIKPKYIPVNLNDFLRRLPNRVTELRLRTDA